MRRTSISFILVLLLGSQAGILAQDSLYVLTAEKYLQIVLENHPLAKQADILREQGAASVGQARGAFDPKLFGDYAKKSFAGKTYYDNFEGGLKVPTWFGLEFYSGFEQNKGVFLNPENFVPDGGLAVAGVSLPVGRGLFIDKRRAELRKAQIYQNSTLAERRALLNKLSYEAGKAYWEWFKGYNVLSVYRDALSLAQERLGAVKQGARLGDRAFIDTLEAEIQVQNRALSVQEAEMELNNAQEKLELYLWQDGIIPLELDPGTVPVLQTTNLLEAPGTGYYERLDSLVYFHPELAQTRYKLDQLGIEQRLKREQLKPQLDLKYNVLSEPVGDSWVSNVNPNDYTFGFSFSMPLFLRKERNALKLANLKTEAMEFELSGKQESFAVKARIALNNWSNSFRQATLAQQRVRGYSQLLEGERTMFRGGESSLFLVNSRESSYVQAQIKYLEILAKNRKAALEAQFSLGLLAL